MKKKVIFFIMLIVFSVTLGVGGNRSVFAQQTADEKSLPGDNVFSLNGVLLAGGAPPPPCPISCHNQPTACSACCPLSSGYSCYPIPYMGNQTIYCCLIGGSVSR